MDNFEKVEKLVNKAGVSYEEAKSALERANGDLLDAMILLEREGKTASSGTGSYSTRYEEQTQYVPVAEAAAREEKSGGKKFSEFCRKVGHFLSSNYLIIARKGEQMAKLPLWLMVIILLFAWHISLILIIVSLFFGFTYRFCGETDMESANTVMDKASSAAEKVKEEFGKL